MHREEKSNKTRAPLWNREPALCAYALVLFAASILLNGYKVYFHNQALQLPLVSWLNDRSLYPHDPFAATLPYYASCVWRLVAICARTVSLETVLLVFFLGERLLLIYAAGMLARTFAPGSRLAAVCAMAFFALMPQPILGGGTISMPYFEQTSLAIAFYMLAIPAFHRSCPAAWAFWLALGFNCNSLYGVYALTYFGATFLLDPDYRRAWRRWIPALLLFGLIASPAIVMSAGAYGEDSFNNSLWIVASKVRIPHHIFPSTWPPRKFILFGAMLLTVIFLLWKDRSDSPRLYRHSLIWSGVSVAWVLCAVAAELMRSSSLMILQPARATDLWHCFTVVALLCACVRAAEEGKSTSLHFATVIIIALCFWYPNVFWYRIELALVCPLLVVWSILKRRTTRISPERAALGITLLLMAIGTASFALRANSSASNLHSTIRGISQAVIQRPPPSLEAVGKWAAAHTARDSIFLVSPNWGEFRALSRRGVFVTWKDGSALLWRRSYAGNWVERIRALGYDVTRRDPPGTRISKQLDDLYNALTDSAVSELSAKYGIRYWVVPRTHSSAFPAVFENRYFKVLKVKSARKSHPEPANPDNRESIDVQLLTAEGCMPDLRK